MKPQPFLVMFKVNIQRTLTNGPTACWECRFIKRISVGKWLVAMFFTLLEFSSGSNPGLNRYEISSPIFQDLLTCFSSLISLQFFRPKHPESGLIIPWNITDRTKVRRMKWNGGIIKMPWQQHLCRVEDCHQILIIFSRFLKRDGLQVLGDGCVSESLKGVVSSPRVLVVTSKI